MADDDKKETQQNDDDQESKFWEKMGSLIDERVDAGIARTIDKYKITGSSRNGGRTTLPEIMANVIFGKAKTE